MTVCGDEENCDFSKFLAILDAEEEWQCYQAFYDVTSNKALLLQMCPICGWEKFVKEGKETMLLSVRATVAWLNQAIRGSKVINIKNR